MKRQKNRFSCAPRRKRAAVKRRAISVYEESRADGDTTHKAPGRAAHEKVVRRGGLEASEQC